MINRILGAIGFAITVGASAVAGAQNAAADGRPGRAALAGRIMDSTGNPLPMATVIARGLEQSAVTDSTGQFHVARLPAETVQFSVMRIGYRELSFEVGLLPDTTVVVEVRLRSVRTLDEILVTAERPSARFMATGFEHRRRLGNGSFVTPQRIDSLRPHIMHTSQLLRDVPGVELRCSVGGCEVSPRREPRCLWIFIDGVETRGSIDDFVSPSVVQAIEVYPRPTLVPAEFQGRLPDVSGSLTKSGGCGAIAIWTQSRR